MDQVRQRYNSAKEPLKAKQHLSGWILPKQQTSFAPDGTWTNIDMDVTPVERRVWKTSSILGYWLSDILSAQSWEIGASVLQVGLTWREAVYCCTLGSFIMALPIAFNGAPGAFLRVPFPVWIRASFGYHFSKFAIVVRLVTALFWTSIQTYTGGTAMTVMLTAIWPSYKNIPNHLPASAGITSQGLLSHLLFWLAQTPFVVVQPHKLKWFFVFKAFVTITAATGTTIAICRMAHGSGDIWDQKPTVTGWTKAWLIVSTLNSQTGSWSTVGTNISDFTRYVKNPRTTYVQTIVFPLICIWLALLGIISASASKRVYGEYVWDPVTLASYWTSPAGRLGAFYCGFAWITAQIGVTVSANIISASNDLSSLFPKYLNLRRSALLVSITAAWVMVPWKIVTSAESLLNFMSSLGIFLAPIIAISIADYWIVKKRRIDVPGLYQPHGRYAYNHGFNWRACAALVVSIAPTMPSLVHNINANVDIGGAIYIADLTWYYGFFSAFLVYIVASLLVPAKDTLLSRDEIDALEVSTEMVMEKTDKSDA